MRYILELKIGTLLSKHSKIALVFFCAILICCFWWVMSFKKIDSNAVRFLFIDSAMPNSFDPLDADKSINLNAMRLLYATPIEIGLSNNLTSSVLDYFEYNTENKEIIFRVKNDIFFSNGSRMTTDDVAFSILRMARKRPNFPVIHDIMGLDEWLKSEYPLKNYPDGIIIDNNTIRIKLTKNSKSALFRFTLELFSIIPKADVNLDTGALKNQKPSYSGYYTLLDQKQSEMIFQKNTSRFANSLHDAKAPEHIIYLYTFGNQQIIRSEMNQKNTVLYGTDMQFISNNLNDTKKNLNIKYLPSSRFNFILLNPHIEPFDNLMCRHYFMKEYRRVLDGLYGEQISKSASIFTKIVPGYLDDNALIDTSVDVEISECKKKFFEKEIHTFVLSEKLTDFNDKVLITTLSNLGARVKIEVVKNVSDREKKFMENSNAFLSAGSGFWAEDPIGDVKMFFTKNLHEPLKFILEDNILSEIIHNLDENNSNVSSDLQQLNNKLHSDALLNVVFHTRRFFASKDSSLLVDIPQAVSAPAFWQVINCE